jgi:Holliday junction resolvase RusA-like endonuclease
MSYKFILPIYGVIKKTKNNANCAITFNWSRACHFRTYGSAKKKFKAMIEDQLSQFDKIDGQLKIKYTYYAARKGTDLDNFTVCVIKFFQDALSEVGLIEDDNVNFIICSTQAYGGVDKEKPRVEAEIIQY